MVALAGLRGQSSVRVTTLAGSPAPEAQGMVDARVWAVAAAVGVVFWFAMGVDFPESQRRFARLSG